MGTILVVDDEVKMCHVLKMALEDDGHNVITAGSGQSAIEEIKKRTFELVITDMKMPKTGGMRLLAHIKKADPELPVIIMTAYGTIETAVEAMKEGASDYILKPFDIEQMKQVARKTMRIDKLIKERVYLTEELKTRYGFANIIGKCPQMQKVFELITQVADIDTTVLISGESGTGKELVARAIHYNGRRAQEPFIVVNCAALSETLLESELFGHVKGAFTGAQFEHRGRFERAHNGSLFLDEIGAMSPNLQSKLLRVIETKEFERVGGTRAIHVDVRIIAATNRNLKEDIESKSFREDLYYRLNVFPITLSPLRERREDIPLLAGHFINMYSRQLNKNIGGISQDAMQVLADYNWPGNVRELGNMIERGAVLTESGCQITVNVLPLPQGAKGDVTAYKDAKKMFEQDFFRRALAEAGGNISRAAKKTGMDRKNFYQKLKSSGINI